MQYGGMGGERRTLLYEFIDKEMPKPFQGNYENHYLGNDLLEALFRGNKYFFTLKIVLFLGAIIALRIIGA